MAQEVKPRKFEVSDIEQMLQDFTNGFRLAQTKYLLLSNLIFKIIHNVKSFKIN